MMIKYVETYYMYHSYAGQHDIDDINDNLGHIYDTVHHWTGSFMIKEIWKIDTRSGEQYGCYYTTSCIHNAAYIISVLTFPFSC